MLWSLRNSDQNWWHVRARNVKTLASSQLDGKVRLGNTIGDFPELAKMRDGSDNY